MLITSAEAKLTRILVVDDEQANVILLQRLLLAQGFANVRATTSSAQALPLWREFQPNLVLLDLHMPPPDGIELMRQIRALDAEAGRLPTPILVLTADTTRETKQKALELGANDFLTKPLDATETLLRIKNLLAMRLLQVELRKHNAQLELRVRERTHELEQARYEIAERLAVATEYRDDHTGQHTRRVATLSAVLAQRLELPDPQVELIRRAAPLHDIGKIAIPDHILLKPGHLTPDEFQAIKPHTTIGAKILAGSSSDLLQLAEQIALTHHERWDGEGYPHRLRGSQIPVSGRLVAAADVFDALTHDRPYKEAWPLEKALLEIRELGGHHLDPEIAELLTSLPANVLLAQADDAVAA